MKKTILILFAVFCFTSINYSQVSLKVGGGLGYVTPAGDYGGTTMDFYNGSKYGLSSGFNLHLKAKVAILMLAVKAEVDYSSFSNDGEALPGQGQVELSHKILALRVGPEFRIDIPLVPIVPYLDANIALNTISGEVTFQGTPNSVPSGTYEIASASRIGFGFGGGVEISLGPVMTLDAGIHYNLVNPLGKQYKSNTNFRRIDSYTALNDDKDPLYNTDPSAVISDSRSISNIQFTLSLLFGF